VFLTLGPRWFINTWKWVDAESGAEEEDAEAEAVVRCAIGTWKNRLTDRSNNNNQPDDAQAGRSTGSLKLK